MATPLHAAPARLSVGQRPARPRSTEDPAQPAVTCWVRLATSAPGKLSFRDTCALEAGVE